MRSGGRDGFFRWGNRQRGHLGLRNQSRSLQVNLYMNKEGEPGKPLMPVQKLVPKRRGQASPWASPWLGRVIPWMRLACFVSISSLGVRDPFGLCMEPLQTVQCLVLGAIKQRARRAEAEEWLWL